MKSLFTLLIALLYLTVSTGLAVEIHHCMGKVEDFSLGNSKSEDCGKCGMPKGDNACCKDELKFIKLDDSHKLLDAGFHVNIPVAIHHTNYQVVTQPFSTQDNAIHTANHSPPSLSPVSLYIKNCVFRI